MRLLMSGLLALAVSSAGTATADEMPKQIDAKLLVGRWEPKGKLQGDMRDWSEVVVEYTADGKLTVTGLSKLKPFRTVSTYAVRGDTLTMTVKDGGFEFPISTRLTALSDTEHTCKSEKGEITLIRSKKK